MTLAQIDPDFKPTKIWQKSSVIYQIYPTSFFDSNGDGIGDLNGITQKLDYLKYDLGVDILWLSPIYKSPLADMGYDISDYRDIDSRYGTLEEWDTMLHAIHQRDMKLMMDLVVNHTSDEHEWFIESRSRKNNPKRNWYIWRPPKYDSSGRRYPPNNWKSVFQGPAWTYDETTEEYYLHLFASKQPDLNWENPEVRQAAFDIMQFWIDRGCDGFRMDVINLLSKVEGLPDAPIVVPGEDAQSASMYFANGPRVHEFIKEMHEKVLSKKDIITVGETPFTHSMTELAAYVLPQNRELNMVFHFDLMEIDSPFDGGPDGDSLKWKEWKVSELRDIISKWQRFMREDGFWNAVYIENHDHSRAVSRFGNDTTDELRAASAKLLCLLQITQSGTLFIYQGQELGLKNFPRSWGIEEYKDVASQNYWNRVLEERRKQHPDNQEIDMSDILDNFQKTARDHARVPMQWDASANAGFTQGVPWMRVNEDYKTWNAAAQIEDQKSVLAFWKRALIFRKQNETLIYGDFLDISSNHPSVFAYVRILENTKFLVVLNFKQNRAIFELPPNAHFSEFRLVLGNYATEEAPFEKGLTSIQLNSYEGKVYLVA